ncbi:MAG TPA: recombinase [Desulfitobacteriaceae bacterium]|nr:recombinase [Desulfitobacteriaceae bacterium]
MSHTPYGYIIVNGKAVIDKKAAVQIRELFQAYLSGLSLAYAAKKVGLKRYHASITGILSNKRYIEDDYYPQIIDDGIFEKAQTERLRRAQMLGRIREPAAQKAVIQSLHFSAPSPKQLYDDPFKQAEYAYSLIESEVITDSE